MKSAKNTQWKICKLHSEITRRYEDGEWCDTVDNVYYEYVEDFNGAEKNADKRCRYLEENDEINKENETKSIFEHSRLSYYNVKNNEYFYCKTLNYLEEKRKAGYKVIGLKEDCEYDSWTKDQLIGEILKLKGEIKGLKEN